MVIKSIGVISCILKNQVWILQEKEETLFWVERASRQQILKSKGSMPFGGRQRAKCVAQDNRDEIRISKQTVFSLICGQRSVVMFIEFFTSFFILCCRYP